MAEDGDDVIRLDDHRRAVVADEPARVLRRKREEGSKPFCYHRHFFVSLREAEVECQDCGAALDPWTVLRLLANEHEQTWMAIAAARAEKARLVADVEMLKAARAKLRKVVPKAEQRQSLEPTVMNRWRVHSKRGQVSPWMTELDAKRLASRHPGARVEEAPG